MRTPLRERVEAGAALLDKKRRRPAWRRRIDLEELDLGDFCNCVLGQLYGDYEIGLDRLDVWDGNKDVALGFCTYDDPRPLTRAWRKYIEETK